MKFGKTFSKLEKEWSSTDKNMGKVCQFVAVHFFTNVRWPCCSVQVKQCGLLQKLKRI